MQRSCQNRLGLIAFLIGWILLTIHSSLAGESNTAAPKSTDNQPRVAGKSPPAATEVKDSKDQRIKIISQAFKAYMQAKPAAPSNLRIVSGR